MNKRPSGLNGHLSSPQESEVLSIIRTKKIHVHVWVYISLVFHKTSDICACKLRLALMIDVNIYTFILLILLFGVFSLKKECDSIY